MSIEPLGPWYGRDGGQIYGIDPEEGDWRAFAVADPNTFEALRYGIGRDQHAVYAFSWAENAYVQTDLDAASFNVLDFEECILVRDKTAIYYAVGSTDDEPLAQYPFRRLEGVEPESFELMNRFFARTKFAVYRLAFDGGFTAEGIDGADVSSFSVSDVCDKIGWDSRHLFVASPYDRFVGVVPMRPPGFEKLRLHDDFLSYLVGESTIYALVLDPEGTNRRVELIELDAVDAQSFTTTSIRGLVRDRSRYFWSGHRYAPIETIDVSTFRVVTKSLACDKHACYFFGVEEMLRSTLPDPESIQPLRRANGKYFKDKEGIYVFVCEGEARLERWDHAEVLSAVFVKDKRAVYRFDVQSDAYVPIEDVDPARFSLVPNDPKMGTDGTIVFDVRSEGEPARRLSDLDAKTLVCLEPGKYYRDKDHVYKRALNGFLAILEGEDPATFAPPARAPTLREKLIAQDKRPGREGR
ncbi:MAG: DKNYY domain-containing protein [Deltaproteobacteria bacterium]|nr:DKNYY domain-containing protein [Deltaproteobacteria bacterium]